MAGSGVLEYCIAETQATAVSICLDFNSLPGMRVLAHVVPALCVLSFVTLASIQLCTLYSHLSLATSVDGNIAKI